MGPINWAALGFVILRTLGQVGLSLLLSLLNGKAVKRLIAIGLEKWAKWTGNTMDDRVVREIEKDWGLDPEGENQNGK